MTTFLFPTSAPPSHIGLFDLLISPFSDISSHQQYHQSIADNLTFSTWSLPFNSLRYCGRYSTFYDWYILEFCGADMMDIASLDDLDSIARSISSSEQFWWVAWPYLDRWMASDSPFHDGAFGLIPLIFSVGKYVFWPDPARRAEHFDGSHGIVWMDREQAMARTWSSHFELIPPTFPAGKWDDGIQCMMGRSRLIRKRFDFIEWTPAIWYLKCCKSRHFHCFSDWFHWFCVVLFVRRMFSSSVSEGRRRLCMFTPSES